MKIYAWKIEREASTTKLSQLELSSGLRSLDQVSMGLPGGVYTTFRTFEGIKVIHLEDHFWRLEQSSRLAGRHQQVDRSHLRDSLRSILNLIPEGRDYRIRITMDLESCPGDIYIALQTLETPSAEVYLDGARLVTRELHRPLPEAKLTGFIEKADLLRQGLPPGVEEAVLLDSQGQLLEGLSSNFFAVLEGQLWTAGEGVLPGITRRLVIDCAEMSGIPLKYGAVSYADLERLEEAFITSSSRSVLPVVQIDGVSIGVGKPGLITASLTAAYIELIAEQSEEI